MNSSLCFIINPYRENFTRTMKLDSSVLCISKFESITVKNVTKLGIIINAMNIRKNISQVCVKNVRKLLINVCNCCASNEYPLLRCCVCVTKMYFSLACVAKLYSVFILIVSDKELTCI